MSQTDTQQQRLCSAGSDWGGSAGSPEKPEVTGFDWRLSGTCVVPLLFLRENYLFLFLANQKKENNSSQEPNRKGKPISSLLS